MFNTEIVGRMMKYDSDIYSRYRAEIWFDYTKKAMNEIKEGALLAVQNFSSTSDKIRYCILEITSVIPLHYGLDNDLSGYPGFLTEAAENIYRDWEEQEEEPLDDATKIRCLAIPTNFEIIIDKDQKVSIGIESNLPMVGAEAFLLDEELTNCILNYDIDKSGDVIEIGHLIRDENVKILLKVEELLRVHFGVFGFTGAGKSNLLSTLVRKILTESNLPVKIVIFDLMGEYSTLLVDLLVKLNNSMIVGIGEKTFVGSLISLMKADRSLPEYKDLLKKATIDVVNSSLYPKGLVSHKDLFKKAFFRILQSRKVKIWQSGDIAVADFAKMYERTLLKGNLGKSEALIKKLYEQLLRKTNPLNATVCLALIQYIENKYLSDEKLGSIARSNLELFVNELKKKYEELKEFGFSNENVIDQKKLIEILNSPDEKALVIFQSHDPDELRNLAYQIGMAIFEDRRRSGKIDPVVSFIFDEADEFIPQDAKDSYERSSEVVMHLARRGRKFGLGIGIATQRITYLNTNIMAQPHTYFVSKLPRKSDQERITDAFGISEDMFKQTFKFKKGCWLLVSYDAIGLEAVPLPIYVQNANDAVLEFLRTLQ